MSILPRVENQQLTVQNFTIIPPIMQLVLGRYLIYVIDFRFSWKDTREKLFPKPSLRYKQAFSSKETLLKMPYYLHEKPI